jgi:transposase
MTTESKQDTRPGAQLLLGAAGAAFLAGFVMSLVAWSVADLTALRNQLHQQLVQLEPARQGRWPRLTQARGLTQLSTLTVPDGNALLAAHALQVRLLATRMLLLMAQIETLTQEIETVGAGWTEPLQEIVGVDPLTAGMLAAHLGGRVFTSDAHLAMYAGVAPLEASSAGHVRHRLNRTGNRHLNAILHRIALSQSRHSVQACTYLARKRGEGKTRTEAFRCLKRLLARVILTAWRQCQVPRLVDLDPRVAVAH